MLYTLLARVPHFTILPFFTLLLLARSLCSSLLRIGNLLGAALTSLEDLAEPRVELWRHELRLLDCDFALEPQNRFQVLIHLTRVASEQVLL